MHRISEPGGAPFIVDVGCGTGIGAIAARSVIGDVGSYLGLDVRAEDVEFCIDHYPYPNMVFKELKQRNDMYRPDGEPLVPWPVGNSCADLVTAVSVWTHLSEADARFALAEAARVLRMGGRLLMTAFVKDESGERSGGSAAQSRYHATAPTRWNFDRPLGGGWYTTDWADPPEAAIAISHKSLENALSSCGLELERTVPGTWSETPGLFFQDLLVAKRL